MWIHEHQDWPDFIWDAEALASKLADVRHRQGRLLGRMEGLGFDLKREASLGTLTNDVVKSSAIEGENLNPEEVRSAIARRLGIDIAGLIPASRDVEGIVEMMLDATRQFSKPLKKDRLFDWLSWFLDCLGRAITNAEKTLGNVLFKAQLWDTINQKPVSDRQHLIINRMLEDDFEGFMNTSKYAKLAKCSNDTALRDIQELKESGIFIQNPGGGRSTSCRPPNRED